MDKTSSGERAVRRVVRRTPFDLTPAGLRVRRAHRRRESRLGDSVQAALEEARAKLQSPPGAASDRWPLAGIEVSACGGGVAV